MNPKLCKSSNAWACSLPVRSGISTRVGAPPSTGKLVNTWFKVHIVPKTKPKERSNAGSVNRSLTFGLVRSTRFSLVCSDCREVLCWRRTARKSSADLNRSNVDFSNNFKTAFSTPLGISFLKFESFSGLSVKCFVAVEIGDSPLNGGFPAISSYKTVPREYKSDSIDTGLPCACSGEI